LEDRDLAKSQELVDDMVMSSDSFTVAATKNDGFSAYYFEVTGNSPFVICDAAWILTTHNSDDFIRDRNSGFVMNLVVPDDVNCSIR
jgi:hypothetical protein